MKHLAGKDDFWFLPLGGSGEIGMNLNLYGHDKQWLMVDLGITFHDRLGIEILMPDPSFISEQRKNLVGLVLTHAHEDHLGAIPYLWPYLRCPIYATPFTAYVLRQKLKEKPWGSEVSITEIPLSGTLTVGKFEIEFITLTHSIPEPNALAITTPLGTVMHTGDWKIDKQPLVGKATDHARLQHWGDKGVLAMVCDSTNVFNEAESGSEEDVRTKLTEVIGRYKKSRVVVACFSSNIARLETAALAAKEHGRYVALVGRSLHKMAEAARHSGYLKTVPNFISDAEAMSMPKDKVLFITTGSQGEPRSALARIASGSHPVVKLDKNDVAIFSSRVIPGNEKSISLLQNNLTHQGVETITSSEEDIHVSGHPGRAELRQMYEWVRPQMLIPVHGEARHLKEQSLLGKASGIKEVAVPQNGSLISLKAGEARIIDAVPAGRWAVDGNRLIPFESPIIKDRLKLSLNGMVAVTLIIDSDNQLARSPHFAFLGLTESGEDTDDIQEIIEKDIERALTGHYKDSKARDEALQKIIRKTIYTELGKKPIIELHCIEVE